MSENNSPNKSNSFKLFDEPKKWEIKGHQLVIDIDMITVNNLIAKYHSALRFARNLPSASDSIDPGHPVVRHYLDQIYWIDDRSERAQEAIRMARFFFESQLQEVYSDAVMLALFSNGPNTYDFEPLDYKNDIDDNNNVPGISLIDPVLKKDIRNPVEKRYKQILDLIESDAVKSIEITKVLETAAVYISQRADQYVKEMTETDKDTGF